MTIIFSITQAVPLLAFSLISAFGFSGPYWDFILSCVWGLLIFQSLLGYGKLVLLSISDDPLIKPVAPVLGMAFLFAVGAYLNLTGLFIRPIILILIAFGVVYFFWLSVRHLKVSEQNGEIQNFFSKPISDQLIFSIHLIVCCWVYLIAASQTQFNIHDDAHGYLFFPHKLLELGTLGVDPFSERRVISGFGASALWNGLGLSYVQPAFIHLMDLGIGFLVLSYIVAQFPVGHHFYKTKFLFLIAIGLIKFPITNITPNFIAIPVILSIWIVILSFSNQLTMHKNISKAYWLILGAICFTLVVLKNTYLPYTALSLLVPIAYFHFALGMKLENCIKGMLYIAFTIGILVAPWAIDLKRAAGTYFYPFLGVGYHAIQYGYFPVATSNFMLFNTWMVDLKILLWPLSKSIFIFSLLFAAIYVPFYLYKRLSDRKMLIPCIPILISIINVLVVGYAIGGYGAYRFVYSPAIASLLAALILTFYLISHAQLSLKFRYFFYALLCMLSIRAVHDTYAQGLNHIAHIQNSILMGGQILGVGGKSYERLSSAIPKDGGVLVRIDYPFLISPLGSNVYIADYPGAASPMPGMPIGEGPQSLREYLLSKGINYVVWGYGNEANFSKSAYGHRLNNGESSWINSEARLAFDFQENVEFLRKKYSNIYDESGIAIIDLR